MDTALGLVVIIHFKDQVMQGKKMKHLNFTISNMHHQLESISPYLLQKRGFFMQLKNSFSTTGNKKEQNHR